MRLYIDAICDRGTVRPKNEDMVLVGDRLFRNDKMITELDLHEIDEPVMIGIADGMGGHKGGDIASEIVLSSYAEATLNLLPNLNVLQLETIFNKVTQDTHQYILEQGINHKELQGMGATIVAVLFYEGRIFFISAGDSRLYRFRKGYLRQINRDHSISEMRGLPREKSHLIYNSIGGGETSFIDFHYIGDIVMRDDVMLLCSDGLSDLLTDDEIEDHIAKECTGADLVDAAKLAGGSDNISTILIDILED